MDSAAQGLQSLPFPCDVVPQARPQFLVPADDPAVVLDETDMFAAGGMRLCAQARVTDERRLMLHHLAERRAAVAFAIDKRPNVEMGVDVDDADRFAGLHVAQKHTERR